MREALNIYFSIIKIFRSIVGDSATIYPILAVTVPELVITDNSSEILLISNKLLDACIDSSKQRLEKVMTDGVVLLTTFDSINKLSGMNAITKDEFNRKLKALSIALHEISVCTGTITPLISDLDGSKI